MQQEQTGGALRLTHGEVFMVLAHRSKLSAGEIADALGFSAYTYLSKLYKRDIFKPPLIMSICNLLNYPLSVFETQCLDDLHAHLADLERRVKILEAERDALKTTLSLVNLRLEDCERQSGAKTVKSN